MSDAPEQIYAWPSYGENSAAGVWGVTRYAEYAVEYVRADLYEALQARVAELEDQIDSAMMVGHDMAKNEYRDIISGLEARVAELEIALIEAEAAHATARDDALEEAADCAIDNHDCDAWEIAAIIRAMKKVPSSE